MAFALSSVIAQTSLLRADRPDGNSTLTGLPDENDLEKAENESPARIQGENPNDETNHGQASEGVDGHDEDGEEELDDTAMDQDDSEMTTLDQRFALSSSTLSSSSLFVRPSPPRWLSKIKDILFTDHQNDKVYIPNYRITPIISGGLIPFSILLGIPGLTGHWYVRIENNQIIEIKPNTPLLEAALAISMTCAVAANITLLFRFLERRVKVMTVATAVLLTVHGMYIALYHLPL